MTNSTRVVGARRDARRARRSPRSARPARRAARPAGRRPPGRRSGAAAVTTTRPAPAARRATAGGTSVVLPVPGGACTTATPARAGRAARSSRPATTGRSGGAASSRAIGSRVTGTVWRASLARVQMHPGQVDVDVALVRRLLGEQHPQWADLPVTPVAELGTDHWLFRLGDDLVARMPRIAWAADQADSDARWLPGLAAHLPVRAARSAGAGRADGGLPLPLVGRAVAARGDPHGHERRPGRAGRRAGGVRGRPARRRRDRRTAAHRHGPGCPDPRLGRGRPGGDRARGEPDRRAGGTGRLGALPGGTRPCRAPGVDPRRPARGQPPGRRGAPHRGHRLRGAGGRRSRTGPPAVLVHPVRGGRTARSGSGWTSSAGTTRRCGGAVAGGRWPRR